MLDTIRRWHWILLHRVLGLPDRDHGGPHASLSAILRSHPVVPAHHRRAGYRSHHSVSSQLAREMRRQPRMLRGWQRGIGDSFARLFTHGERRDV